MSHYSPETSAFTLTRAQVRAIDRRAIEQYGIPGIVLMENAGRSAAEIIRCRILPGLGRGGRENDGYTGDARAAGARVAIVCGAGNNGGDGFVIARHLSLSGVDVRILLACDPRRFSAEPAGDAAVNYAIVRRMELPIEVYDDPARMTALRAGLTGAEVIVDALLGTGFVGPVRPPLDLAIEAINTTRGAFVVAVDVPSGLDCDTGAPGGAAVRADATITFVARKAGFDRPGAAEYVGAVHVAEIGAPRRLIREIATMV